MASAEESKKNRPNDKMVWWLVGIIGSVLLIVVGNLYQNLTADMTTLRLVQQSRGERIAVLEAQAVANRDNVGTIKNDIDYIKRRLDQLIQSVGRLPATTIP